MTALELHGTLDVADGSDTRRRWRWCILCWGTIRSRRN